MWADGRQGMVAGFTPQERGRVPIKAKIDIRWAQSYQGLLKPYSGEGWLVK